MEKVMVSSVSTRRAFIAGLAASFATGVASASAAERLPPVDQHRLDTHFKTAIDGLAKDPLHAFGRLIRLTTPNAAQYAALANRGTNTPASDTEAPFFNTELYSVLLRYTRMNKQLPALHPLTDSLLDINEGVYPVSPSKNYRDISNYLDVPPESTARYIRTTMRTQFIPALFATFETSLRTKDWTSALVSLAALQDAMQMADFAQTPRHVFKAAPNGDPLADAVSEFFPDDRTLAGVRPADTALKACGLQPAVYDASVAVLLSEIARQGYDRLVKNIVANSKAGPDDKRFNAAWQGLRLTQWALGNLLMMRAGQKAKPANVTGDPRLVLTQPAATLLADYNTLANTVLGTPDCGLYKSHLWLLGSNALFDESRHLYDGGLADRVGALKPLRATLQQGAPYCADIVAKPRPF